MRIIINGYFRIGVIYVLRFYIVLIRNLLVYSCDLVLHCCYTKRNFTAATSTRCLYSQISITPRSEERALAKRRENSSQSFNEDKLESTKILIRIKMSEEPAMKRAKLEISNEYDIISDYMNKLKNSTNNLKAVLSYELTRKIQTTKVFIASIKDKRYISKAIQVLNEKLPLNELSHLKRVRKNNILLCQSSTVNTPRIQEFIDAKIPELKDVFELICEIDVPSEAPKLKEQYTEATKVWSCNFHPDMYLEKLSSDNFFPKDELYLHQTYMAIAFETVRWYLRSNVKEITEDLLQAVNASVVVDPSISSVVAVSFDNRLMHPVQHSAMIAIDDVARTQDGGAWTRKTTCNNTELSGIDVELLEHLRIKFPHVKYGAKKFISKEEIVENGEKENTGPYLCTNYYIYLLKEPCFMCSMALIHARVKRVFFCFDNAQFGALKSKAKLHMVQSLNHHYEVFTGFL